jgi:hypothetical protein
MVPQSKGELMTSQKDWEKGHSVPVLNERYEHLLQLDLKDWVDRGLKAIMLVVVAFVAWYYTRPR